MKAAEFVGTLFLARDVAHSVHLNVKGIGSYAKHVALNEFYDNIVELADKFAEAYQGRHGLIGPIMLMSAKKTGGIVDFIKGSLKDIEDARYEVCSKNDTALQNIIDEIVGQYLSTLYKLENLQ
jgi:hypothetical protein